ncbi:MAG: M20/M25/M40 family metallo-hydrolase [Terrisporobacter sp.]
MEVNINEVAKRLSKLIQVKSLSNEKFENIDFQPFFQIKSYLREFYPIIHDKSKIEIIHEGAFVYKIEGNTSNKLPLLFMGHMDVVAAGEDTLNQWKVDPFSGVIEDEIVWGRGAKDMKSQIISFFEATEYALKYEIERDYDLYFSLGYDEEVGGRNGAKYIADYFKKQNIKFGMIIDEGGMITDGILGLLEEIALVGTCEKGYVDLKITYAADGGHSSMPPTSTALGKICEAACKLENNQMPVRITEPLSEMLVKLSKYLKGSARIALEKNKIFSPIVKSSLSKSPASNALARTTTALTMAKGSDASNVLPNLAYIVVNFRLLPGDTLEELLTHVKNVIGEEYNIEVLISKTPSKFSKVDEYFDIVSESIKKAYPHVAEVVPFIMVGGTDSIYMDDLSDHIYKFGPFRCSEDERKVVHGVNEFMRFKDLKIGIDFFYNVINKY